MEIEDENKDEDEEKRGKTCDGIKKRRNVSNYV